MSLIQSVLCWTKHLYWRWAIPYFQPRCPLIVNILERRWKCYKVRKISFSMSNQYLKRVLNISWEISENISIYTAAVNYYLYFPKFPNLYSENISIVYRCCVDIKIKGLFLIDILLILLTKTYSFLSAVCWVIDTFTTIRYRLHCLFIIP